MKSQEIRKLAPEMDPLRIGMGWTVEDLEKPQILIESTYGQSHPGSAHLLELAQKAYAGAGTAGGKGALYFATDICDGMAQGHDGINYSLASRDTIANLIEIHANATTFDAGVFLSSCDKSVPAQLMAIGRIDIPSIVVTGGVMDAGPDLLTLEQIGMYSAMFQRGEITEDQFLYYKHHACPSCGACSFMGTASTMQIMAEALGLMLPGSALMPATCSDLRDVAERAGRQAVKLAEMGLTARQIVTKESFENAIIVHAAISGSTNTLLHIPAIAHEFGIEIDADTFDRMHRGAHYLLDIRPAGRWPAQYFYYAGGVPRIMEEIKDMLHLDAMTVTGKTLGENLEDLKKSGYYETCDKYLRTTGCKRTDIIRTFEEPIGTDGTIAILKGNLAPEGAVVKHSAVPKEMFKATLRARPFNCEEDAIAAVFHLDIEPGVAVIIRYEVPKGSGMPELFYTTEAISSDPL
ncbi:MAG: dihydroxy-acid dehydratase, partial [Clostridia bacterium]|nr:dihydroxy-acid dehydratase [Clostridia bacterium]